MTTDDKETLTAEHFEPLAGQIFRFPDAGAALTLDRVHRERPNGPPSGGRAPFTLIFRGPKTRDALPEGLHACEAESGPRFRLYVAPIHTPAADRQDYQAVFN